MFLHHSKTVPRLWRNRLEDAMKQLSVRRHSSYPMLNLWGPRCLHLTLLWMFLKNKTPRQRWSVTFPLRRQKRAAIVRTRALISGGPSVSHTCPLKESQKRGRMSSPVRKLLKWAKTAPLKSKVSCHSTLPCVCAKLFLQKDRLHHLHMYQVCLGPIDVYFFMKVSFCKYVRNLRL